MFRGLASSPASGEHALFCAENKDKVALACVQLQLQLQLGSAANDVSSAPFQQQLSRLKRNFFCKSLVTFDNSSRTDLFGLLDVAPSERYSFSLVSWVRPHPAQTQFLSPCTPAVIQETSTPRISVPNSNSSSNCWRISSTNNTSNTSNSL